MKRRWLGSLFFLATCGGGGSPGTGAAPSAEDWLPVVRGDLLLEVDVGGVLKATRSSPLQAPEEADDRDFKIARMANEGAAVKKGDPVLWFDTSEMERERLERASDVEESTKEIVRKQQDIELDSRQGELRLLEAEAKASKARLKADLPEKYTSAVEMKLAKIDSESAEAELRMAKQRLVHSRKLNQAELAFLRDRLARFRGRLDRLQGAIKKMTVFAPTAGVVVYRMSWRGEKKKVGDPCWVGEPCLEVTDLADMEGRGEVDELESSRVRVGQTMTFRLDALPEVEWNGTVEALRPNVYRQSPRNPLKVIGINIAIQKTDSQRMRPGMQFRGRLLTDTIKNALLLPIESVFTRGDGTYAFRKTATGFERVKVELGRRSRSQVEVKSGLQAADKVSRRDLDDGLS